MKISIFFSMGISAASAATQFAGVNIAGFDFGMDIQGSQVLNQSQGPILSLGTDRSDGAGQMQHFVQDDRLNTFRLPVTWQFLINSTDLASTSNQTLDRTNMAAYDTAVRACLNTGASCIIDVHNYARFEGKVIGQGGPTNAQFASLWSQIAAKYRNETKVIFGVMNEPHDLPSLPMWADTVQAAVTAIRQAGAAQQTILLPGNEFTHASSFIDNGSAGELSRVRNPDGSNTSLVFEVHQYLDTDDSGTHLECTSDHIQDAFAPLSEFLVSNGRKAFVGEIGGGNASSCITDLCNSIAFINANPDAYMGYTAWSAGGFSPTDYNLTLTPNGSAGSFIDQETVTQCVVGTRKSTTVSALPSANSTRDESPLSKQSPVAASATSVRLSNEVLMGVWTTIACVFVVFSGQRITAW